MKHKSVDYKVSSKQMVVKKCYISYTKQNRSHFILHGQW